MREAGPLPLADGLVTVFARYADCEAVFRHPEARSDRRHSAVFSRASTSAGAVPWVEETPPFLFLDPPDRCSSSTTQVVARRADEEDNGFTELSDRK